MTNSVPFEEFRIALLDVADITSPGTLIRRWREGMTVEQARADIVARPWKPDFSKWGPERKRERRKGLPCAVSVFGKRRGPLLTRARLERLIQQAVANELVRVRNRRMEPETRRWYMALRQQVADRLKKGA